MLPGGECRGVRVLPVPRASRYRMISFAALAGGRLPANLRGSASASGSAMGEVATYRRTYYYTAIIVV